VHHPLAAWPAVSTKSHTRVTSCTDVFKKQAGAPNPIPRPAFPTHILSSALYITFKKTPIVGDSNDR
jgi:hypothetical protein